MKAKKLLAALGVLMMAVPGVAYASADTKVTSEIVEGHTVFAAVLQDTHTDFAAIAGIAAKRTTIGGVLWFNDQELIPASVASEVAAGAYVIATEAGDDAPSLHMDASYLESYQFVDPNDRAWIVDRYTYDVCSIDVASTTHIVPCDAKAADQCVDLDGDGACDDLDGDGNPDPPQLVAVTTKSLYVVEIGATALDSAASCGTATGKDYNFVLLVRMDSLQNTVQDGAQLGSGSSRSQLDGNSAASVPGPVADSTANTAQVDLWFSEDRPPAPATRTLMFPEDTIGGGAPCAAH